MSEEKDFMHIFERIATEHNTTAEEVRQEIEAAIRAGFYNPDCEVRGQWARIPKTGELPTPDELVRYVVRRAEEESLF